jgi:hypothetical protein
MQILKGPRRIRNSSKLYHQCDLTASNMLSKPSLSQTDTIHDMNSSYDDLYPN